VPARRRARGETDYLAAVSCPSPGICTAVGHPRYPAGARGAALSGVSCPSAASTAVGSLTNAAGAGEPLAERWTPRGWAIEPTPAPDATNTTAGPVNAELGGVSCPALTRRAGWEA
jgi:hypothetical protein